jgi:starch phosphorylase
VHVATWTSPAFCALYEKHLGPSFREGAPEVDVASAVAAIPDEELWRVHELERARLVASVRARMVRAAERRARTADAREAAGVLDPRALTIGFARRFATYKRGALLLRDAARLERILTRADRPVQLVFSGKAHPQDWGGKELILEIVRASRREAFRGRILFVEDYDMGVARELVGGVDVWLNTPRRPLEASGTSGMKACLNGALHASILDGWWAEAFSTDSGFAIGHGEEYHDTEYGDRVEAEALYRLLEDEIVPCFYDRDRGGLPRAWIARMKKSIERTLPVFNTHRMVKEYTSSHYGPAVRRIWALTGDGLSLARSMSGWKARVREAWPEVKIEVLAEKVPNRVTVGAPLTITADVRLGALAPSEVAVEIYFGRIDGQLTVPDGTTLPMTCVSELGGQRYRFEGTLPTLSSGEHAFAVRVLPRHDSLPGKFATALSTWSD